MIGGIALNTKHKIILLLTFLTSFFLTGCGKDAELENYKANMNQFFENIRVIDSSINALDPNSETAVSDLLSLLDSMNTSFEQMASLDVPDGFPGVDELADEASEYMSEAVSYYHQAYENGYNANLEDAARQYYESANVRFQYIVSILHGDIPEEIYTYEDETSSEDTAESNDAAFESE
ncbi:hypothetical protein C819_00069 [Lachnospiraceae bacterium 10-1]|nr:hypothetical protein C819_00069 [Lachnospiraceae bacterium 10-1]